ncbi:MAG: choice-of-anchor B family protein, partial [Gemmatimonadota bacterium]|nr:choice-of-anchor B family protein [Gemmatimonadota bacterium]
MRATRPLSLSLLFALAGTTALAGQTLRTAPDAGPPPAGFAVSAAVVDGVVFIGRSGAETRMATYPQSGAVYSFSRGADGTWMASGELAPGGGSVGDQFGSSIFGYGGGLIIGAPGAMEMRGVAYIFAPSNGEWVEALRLDPDAEPNSGAGVVVALTDDQAFLGAPGGRDDLAIFGQPAPPQPGVVYVFEEGTDGAPVVSQRLTSPDGDGSDRFGSSILVFGDRLVVGAPGQSGSSGAAYRFVRTGGDWAYEATLALDDGRAGDRFGAALALDGDALLVGVPGRDRRGAVYAFRSMTGSLPGDPLVPDDLPGGAAFGSSLAVVSDAVLVGAPGVSAGTGATYVFSGGERTHSQTLGAEDFGPGGLFGSSLAADGDLAVIGAGQADLRLGAATVFERRGADPAWTFASVIRDPSRPQLASITGDEVRCEDGSAGEYSCSDVDLVSFIPLSELGAGAASIANDIWGWTDAATGREYVLLGKSNGTSFVDITDPSSPVYLGELPMHEGAQENLWRDIKTYRDHAFIVADGAGAHGLQVFDLTQLRDVTNPPAVFDETAHYDRLYSSHNIVINEETGTAIAVGGGGGAEPCGGGLHMIDIRDPRSPEFAGCFVDPALGGVLGAGYTHDAQCVIYRGPDEPFQGREVCFQASLNALGISDITDRENPTLLARADYPGVVAAHQGWLTEDQRYFYLGDELDEEGGTVENTRTLVWDVTELDDPVLVTQYFAETSAIDHNMYVRGNFLYQSNLMSGLRILDISDPENPVEA